MLQQRREGLRGLQQRGGEAGEIRCDGTVGGRSVAGRLDDRSSTPPRLFLVRRLPPLRAGASSKYHVASIGNHQCPIADRQVDISGGLAGESRSEADSRS